MDFRDQIRSFFIASYYNLSVSVDNKYCKAKMAICKLPQVHCK